jgi:formylglycine-generating enzyme required for sulfatase activity
MKPYADNKDDYDMVVLRGGSWANDHRLDLGNRNRTNPGNWKGDFGFRVVVRPHFSSTP